MHSRKINNTMIWWPRKTNETTRFNVKKYGGELSQENNPLYQIEIYSQKY